MPYKPSHVANAFLFRARNEGVVVNHLKESQDAWHYHFGA